MVRKERKIYRSGHYDNGQATVFGGTLSNSGYFQIKAYRCNASTHRVIAWLWPRNGRKPVMPWQMEVDHIDGDRGSLHVMNLQWLSSKRHNAKTRGAKCNDGKSKPIRGRVINQENEWMHFPSLSEARRQTGCGLDAISNTANPHKKQKRTKKDDKIWEWEWCGPVPDREGETWRNCILPDGRELADVQVSNMGMFKRLSKTGDLKHPGTLEENGYRRINLDGTLSLTHDIVAYTWLGPPAEGQTVVDHIDNDGPKDDNRVANLRWATHSDNLQNGDRASSGPNNSTPVQAFLDEECTRAAHDVFSSQNEAAAWAGLKSSASIRNALTGRAASAGKLDGRPLYWKTIETDLGECAVLSKPLMQNLKNMKPAERKERMHEEDQELPHATVLLQANASKHASLFFEELDGQTLRFFADDSVLGEASCKNVYRMTARFADGLWTIYELP